MKKVFEIFCISLLILSETVCVCAVSGDSVSADGIASGLSGFSCPDSVLRKARIDSAVAARIAAASRYTTTARDRAVATSQVKPGLKRTVLRAPVSQIEAVCGSGDADMGIHRLRMAVDFLCGQENLGRKSGTAGSVQVAVHLADQFAGMGLGPYGGRYLHDYVLSGEINSETSGESPVSDSVGGTATSAESDGIEYVVFSCGVTPDGDFSCTVRNYSELPVHDPKRPGLNVLACIDGEIEEYVVIAAHFDGLGLTSTLSLDSELSDSTSFCYYPGANSNASGVAALLEIARNLKISLNGRKPHRGVIFAALDGHHDDYSGAKALLQELGRRRVAHFINLDILGNASDPVDRRRPLYLMALGAEPHLKALKSCARLGRIEIYTEYYRSEPFTNLFYRKTGDQTVFLQSGIPCIVFTSGISYDTNKISDTPDKVNFNALRDRSLAISRFVSTLLDYL